MRRRIGTQQSPLSAARPPSSGIALPVFSFPNVLRRRKRTNHKSQLRSRSEWRRLYAPHPCDTLHSMFMLHCTQVATILFTLYHSCKPLSTISLSRLHHRRLFDFQRRYHAYHHNWRFSCSVINMSNDTTCVFETICGIECGINGCQVGLDTLSCNHSFQ